MKREPHKGCLSEERLVALYYGDASAEEANHRRSCMDCARSYRRLEQDMEKISTALRRSAPRARRRSAALPMLQGFAVAASVALAFFFAWDRSPETAKPEPLQVVALSESVLPSEDFAGSAEQVGEAIFAESASAALGAGDRALDLTYLQAAFEGELPCAWGDPLLPGDCGGDYDEFWFALDR